MLYGECKYCGNNTWMNDECICPECIERNPPQLSNSEDDPLVRTRKQTEELLKRLG